MKDLLVAIIKRLGNILSINFKKYDKKLPYIITAFITSVIVIVGINVFIELTEDLKSKYLASYDSLISKTIVSYRTPALTEYFIFMTNLGDTWGYLIVFVLCNLMFYLVFRSWKYVAELSLVMILALSSDLILKKIINRARPDVKHLVAVNTSSYPSGHAMLAMAFYGLLIYLVFQFKISKILKCFLILLLVFVILSIGVSRVYLGVHYPSDVAGGYIAGFIWVIFCIMIFNLIKVFKKDSAT